MARVKSGAPGVGLPSQPEGADLSFRDPLQLRYILVDDLVLLEGNPKLHDIGKIADSITENGFRDPIAWDVTLNGGKGGIVEGNGRAETLKYMQDQGRDLPRGIAKTSGGRWAVPVLFGVDSRSEQAAKRYSLDHNSLVLAGGNFTALDMSRLYDQEMYVGFLESLAKTGDLPLTVDGEDLDLLVGLLGEGWEGAKGDGGTEQIERSPSGAGTGATPKGEGAEGEEGEGAEGEEGDLGGEPTGLHDKGIPYVSKYAVAVECDGEENQEKTYNHLTALGYTCKVLTL